MSFENQPNFIIIFSIVDELLFKINVREYRRGKQKRTIERNWQHWVHKTKKNKIKTQHNMCWTPLYTNNINKTWALLQITGGKDEPNIVFMR